jgi:hypothetical protein
MKTLLGTEKYKKSKSKILGVVLADKFFQLFVFAIFLIFSILFVLYYIKVDETLRVALKLIFFSILFFGVLFFVILSRKIKIDFPNIFSMDIFRN